MDGVVSYEVCPILNLPSPELMTITKYLASDEELAAGDDSFAQLQALR